MSLYTGEIKRIAKIFLSNLMEDFPDNYFLYKDSGSWQVRDDDLNTITQQKVYETFMEFFERSLKELSEINEEEK